jgi:hypothetical protein
MTALEQDEALLLAGAALRVTAWTAFQGALLLTDRRLIFQTTWGARGLLAIVAGRDYALPLQSISNPRPTSRLPAFYYSSLPISFFFRNQFRPNIEVTSDGKDYRFRVRDPGVWVQRIETAQRAVKRSW